MRKREKVKHFEGKKFLKILAVIFFITAIFALIYYLYNLYSSNKNKSIYTNISYKETDIPNATTNMKKVASLKAENTDVIGWIQIDDTLIDYPILQSTDNNYYLKHNYKKEKSKYGSIFTKNECNIYDNQSNLIIYGHNMKDLQMFNNLLQYENVEFYEKHKTIKIATEQEENNYNVVAVFKTRVFYEDETNVFRYYNYTNFESADQYDDFINNCKKIQLYDTDISTEFGEKLITLITCDYSQVNGRLVIVAKKI